MSKNSEFTRKSEKKLDTEKDDRRTQKIFQSLQPLCKDIYRCASKTTYLAGGGHIVLEILSVYSISPVSQSK